VSNPLRITAAIGLPAIALAVGLAQPAQAYPPLPNLENLNFLSYTGANPKNTFDNVDPVGWTGGSGLIFIDAPGTSNTSSVTACGPTYLQTYGCPHTLTIPGGYNQVEADGNPSFESGFSYLVTGLTVGTTYTLSFYQAASQQTTFSGATTNQWIVSLGTDPLTVSYLKTVGSTIYDTYSNADPGASVVATTLMHVPTESMVDWNYVTVTLTADSTSDLLSFLAWGNGGSTANEPPMAFLAGVDSAPGQAPEPTSLALFGVGVLGLGVLMLRQRTKGNRAT
jgi:hypothetical protein